MAPEAAPTGIPCPHPLSRGLLRLPSDETKSESHLVCRILRNVLFSRCPPSSTGGGGDICDIFRKSLTPPSDPTIPKSHGYEQERAEKSKYPKEPPQPNQTCLLLRISPYFYTFLDS